MSDESVAINAGEKDVHFNFEISPHFANFVYMKNRRKRVAAKGERLKWTSIKDVKSVKLSDLNIQGRVVVLNSVSKPNSTKMLVP